MKLETRVTPRKSLKVRERGQTLVYPLPAHILDYGHTIVTFQPPTSLRSLPAMMGGSAGAQPAAPPRPESLQSKNRIKPPVRFCASEADLGSVRNFTALC